MSNYLSTLTPSFKPHNISCGKIPAYTYNQDLKAEIAAGNLTAQQAVELYEDMLTIREFEEMIVKLRTGAYPACAGYDYRGPTHVSIGQEATAVGCCAGMRYDDNITSTHRGHGDSLAKGCAAIRGMSVEELRRRLPGAKSDKLKELIEEGLEDHVYRAIAELFGKEDGYCKGRGGGMHIADFRVGHLGANAIVGGGVPIATGAAMSARYFGNGKVTCCFAGDGAYSNGVVLESLNWAAMGQFTDRRYAGEHAAGLPIVYALINNHYGMTGRADGEVTGVGSMARRAAGFADNNLNAEVVNGMNVLACLDAMRRAAAKCRQGEGPVLLEFDTYRYYGHSLSDPRNEYRTKEEETAWKNVDPLALFEQQLLDAGALNAKKLAALKEKVADRNARAAARAAAAADPDPRDVIKYMYTDTRAESVPESAAKVATLTSPPAIKRTDGQLTYKDAIKQALIEEMLRDSRVVLYGEDIAEYGGAFKVTKGLIDAFGRQRVFNSPISEAAICGTAVGAAMTGMRPVVELMYMDFALMASDQIANQAGKWHYMSGATVEVPLVYRASVGGGKGYGGQHSQTLESVFAHIPGLYVVYPATAADAKGMLKSAIRDNNPIMFVESQLLYNMKGAVPEGEYLVPLGVADVKRAGTDVTIVTWGPALFDCLKAAEQLAAAGKSAEVVDLRSLVPLDMETVLTSVRKTGRCVVVSQAVNIGSFTGEVASRIMAEAFDFLDAPVLRVGAKDGIAPQAQCLEAAFLPNVASIVTACKEIL
ncbi:MAG: dehydrogenase E1 component subunit alpha/beta [Kiritimatiellae bacterium]|nr:dehydrogenase E1 component subunit alpha/beta [Kiritimatiellia bacterium]